MFKIVVFFQGCVLMNNIQQTRIQLEKTYQAMGGGELEEDAASILNKQQSQLNAVLDHLAAIFGERYETQHLYIRLAEIFRGKKCRSPLQNLGQKVSAHQF